MSSHSGQKVSCKSNEDIAQMKYTVFLKRAGSDAKKLCEQTQGQKYFGMNGETSARGDDLSPA